MRYPGFQPTICDLPSFTQCSEQVKTQYLCPVPLVKPFDKRVLCRLAWFDKLQYYATVVSPLRQSLTAKIIHHVESSEVTTTHQRIMPVLIHRPNVASGDKLCAGRRLCSTYGLDRFKNGDDRVLAEWALRMAIPFGEIIRMPGDI